MRNPFLSIVALTLAAPLAQLHAQSAPTAPFDLSIKNIMRGPELYGTPPTDVTWTPDSRWIYFQWVAPGSDWRTTPSHYRVRAVAGAKPEKLTLAQYDSAGPSLAEPTFARDREHAAVEYGGDIFVVNYRDGSVRRITHTDARESNPVLGADGKNVYFSRDGNAYAFDLADGLVTQLTDLRTGVEPVDTTRPHSPQKIRLAQEETALFQSVRDEIAADSASKHNRSLLDSLRSPKPIYIGRDRSIQSIEVSPDGRGAVSLLRTTARGTPVEIPFWVTRSGYTEPRPGRTLVGDVQPHSELMYVSFASATASRPKLLASDSLPSYIAFDGWSPSGSDALFFAYSPDNKERILYTLSETDGALHTVEALRDTAWVGGPCSSCAGWLPDGSRVWYVSEATGFAHLYTAAPHGGDVRQLTSGKWEVRSVELSRDGSHFDLVTNEPSPFEEQYYTLPAAGGALTRITTTSGRHAVTVSPNGRLVADVYSYVNRPPDLHSDGESSGSGRVAAHAVAKCGVVEREVDRTAHSHGSGVRWSSGSRPHLSPVRRRRAAEWRSGDLRARRRLSAQRR